MLPMEKDKNLPTTEPPFEQTVVTARFSSMYVGSVPPPDILDAYERHMPGATARFIELVENEQRVQFEIINRNFELVNRDLDLRKQQLDLQKQELDLRMQEDVTGAANFRFGLAASMGIMVLLFGFMFYCASLRLEAALIAALGVPLVGAIGSIIAQFVWRKK